MYCKPRFFSKGPNFASFSEIRDRNGRTKIVKASLVSLRCFSRIISPTKLFPALVGAENIKLSIKWLLNKKFTVFKDTLVRQTAHLPWKDIFNVENLRIFFEHITRVMLY